MDKSKWVSGALSVLPTDRVVKLTGYTAGNVCHHRRRAAHVVRDTPAHQRLYAELPELLTSQRAHLLEQLTVIDGLLLERGEA